MPDRTSKPHRRPNLALHAAGQPHDAEAQSRAGALWMAHRRWVAALLLAHKSRETELEDLLQEVAVRVVAHVDELRDPRATKAWLRTVALNVARTDGRKQTVRREHKEGVTLHIAQTNEREAPAPVSDRGAILEAARALPEAYREPLILRSLRGMSYKQIADTLGVPVTTIETRLVRARRMLREALEPRTNGTPSTDSPARPPTDEEAQP